MPSSSMKTPAELSEALRPVGAALVAVAVASGLINLLMLTGPLFMLQVYDRVLTSRSGATLVGLCIFALVTFLFQGLFEALRSHMLIKIGRAFANRMSPRVLDVLAEARGQEGLQAIRDLDTVRGFAGSGLGALFDLPWTPLYIALCFAFHPSLGIAVLCGALLLALLTWAGDRVSRQPIEDLTSLSTQRNRLTEEMRRNASLIDSLGMRRRMQDVWLGCAGQHLDSNDTASAVSARLGAATRLLRTVLQSGVLALGAWLVINREASGGVMLAATILTIRALSPLEQAMANWRGFVAARQAWPRLNEALAETPRRKAPMLIDLPKRELSLAGVTIAVPGTERAVVANASFTLRAGSALGIVGPSGSGKSSLARALVGTWPAARGVIRLDGATFDQWDRDVIGSALGYLPQDVELLSGTIAQNIARFAPDVPADAVQRAAIEADVHDLILRLPGGYDMQVGEGGAMLSGGQRQRIGLARALFGQPFLVVLDEPNSNLDGAGEQALLRAILGVRKRGGIAVVIAHRPSALAAVDQLMVLNEGHVQTIGPRDAVLMALAGTTPAKPAAEPAKAATRPATKAAAPKARRSRSTKGVVNGHAHALA